MYDTDKPIQSPSEDLLGRANFANQLAKAILRFDSKDNIVIGLYGKWGTGKTSIINMMIREIKQETKCWSNVEMPILFKFEPWNFSDNENLTTQFFRILRNKINLKENSCMKENIGKILEQYSDAMDLASNVPKIGPFAKILKLTMSFAGKTLVDKYSNADIEGAKDRLTTALGNQKKKIIVIIDDIDRLSNDQIRMIFQLVKQIAGFPNITYILSMDKEVVARALEDIQKCDGNEYLEKIVQIPFKIPELDKNTVNQIFFNKLEEILQGNAGREIDMNHWARVYEGCIKPYIGTIRDVNRVTNAFRLKYDMLSEEVNFSDLIAITVLEILQPSILNWILENKILIIGGSYDYNGISFSEQEKTKNAYIEAFEKENIDGELAIQTIAALFPKFGKKVNYNYEVIKESELIGQMRIASEKRFDLYFNLNIEAIGISHVIVNQSIYFLSGEELQKVIFEMDKKDKSITYLEEIYGQINKIPYDRIAMFLKVLYKSKIKIHGEKVGYLTIITAESYAEQCIHALMERLKTTKERFEVYSSLLEYADILLLEGMCTDINRIELGYARLAGNKLDERRQIISLEELEKIEILYAERMGKLAAEDTIFEAKSLLFIKYLWENFAQENCKSYFAEKLQSDIYKLKFMCKMSALWTGTHGKGWTFYKNNYEEYVNEDEVFNLIQNYDKQKMWEYFSEEEILKLACFVLNKGRNELDHASEKEARELMLQWKKEISDTSIKEDLLYKGE